MQMVQRVMAVAIVAAIAAQFFLAGAGAFGATSYAAHRALGYALGAAAVLAFVAALAARRLVVASAALVVTIGVQILLGSLGTSSSGWFGAFHALNALLVMGAAGRLTHQATRRSWKREAQT